MYGENADGGVRNNFYFVWRKGLFKGSGLRLWGQSLSWQLEVPQFSTLVRSGVVGGVDVTHCLSTPFSLLIGLIQLVNHVLVGVSSL